MAASRRVSRSERPAVLLGVGVQQNVAEGGSGGGFHLEDARPAGGVVGGAEFGEAVAVAGATGEDQFAVGGEFEKGAVSEVGAGAVDLDG